MPSKKTKPDRQFAGAALAQEKIVREGEVVSALRTLTPRSRPTDIRLCAGAIEQWIERFQRNVSNFDREPSLVQQRMALTRLRSRCRAFLDEICVAERGPDGRLVRLEFLDFASRARIEGLEEARAAMAALDTSIASAIEAMPRARSTAHQPDVVDDALVELGLIWRAFRPDALLDSSETLGERSFSRFAERCFNLADYTSPIRRRAKRSPWLSLKAVEARVRALVKSGRLPVSDIGPPP